MCVVYLLCDVCISCKGIRELIKALILAQTVADVYMKLPVQNHFNGLC